MRDEADGGAEYRRTAHIYRILGALLRESSDKSIDEIVSLITADYKECFEGAVCRLKKAIKIIILSYEAAAYKSLADAEMKAIEV